MPPTRHVLIDPDESLGDDELFVVVHVQTGVVYHTQYGGTATRQGSVEGYRVPLAAPEPLGELRHLFETTLPGTGTWNYRWPERERQVVANAVASILYWTTDGVSDERGFLRVDISSWAEVDEAWLPVVTPDGPGTLLWLNSD
jgi:hypothetical protein